MEDIGTMGGDKLILRGLKFHGFHGVKPEERTLGQKFLIDVDAWMDLSVAGKSDYLKDTISYTEIYRGRANCFHNFDQVPPISAIRVKVGKPHVAVQGALDYLGVEILRCRSLSSK
ncbi:hypothetical protein K2173_003976 [Erythroxylum novogranatense]|uniref:dihydroneopterin aldolase n=1 Tax=Erythroxylum novogranatense TaxID=1862640 RepID=A0AAV8SKB2_9ROSI|nr:hypothetical protein K2173_003976 [Erythroxylum novogranatense]